jgi:hypothetical protein
MSLSGALLPTGVLLNIYGGLSLFSPVLSGLCVCIRRTDRSGETETMAEMADAAAHRGPHGVGIRFEPRAGLVPLVLVSLVLNVTPADCGGSQPPIDPMIERRNLHHDRKLKSTSTPPVHSPPEDRIQAGIFE